MALGPASLSSSGGFVSGRITGIAVDPTNSSTIYIAAADGGVWKTTNGGTSWAPLTDNQATLAMGAIAIAPSNHLQIYAGTGEANNGADNIQGDGVLVSSDGGSTWTLETASGAFAGVSIGQIAVDPTNAQIAYAAISGYPENGTYNSEYGIWKTTDGGATWTNMTAGVPSATLTPWSSVVVDPNTPTTIYAAAGDNFNSNQINGVYRSTDSGSNWTLLTVAGASELNVGRIALAVSPTPNTAGHHVLYAAIAYASGQGNGGLYYFGRSDNADAASPTFTNLTSGTPDFLGGENGGGAGWYDIAVNVDSNGVVYCSGVMNYNTNLQLAIKSANLGVTWTDISVLNGFEPHTDTHAIAFDSSNNMLLGTDGGIFLYSPTAGTWTDLNGNLNTIQFYGIGLDPTAPNKVVGGSQDNGTEVYSGNVVWNETAGGDGAAAQISQTNSSDCYAMHPIASFGASSFFQASTDGCSTWNDATNALGISNSNKINFTPPFVVDPTNGSHLVLGTDNANESTDNGTNWTPIGIPGTVGFNPSDNAVDSVALAPKNGTNPQVIYAATGGMFASTSQIFVSSNDGATWTEHDLPTCTQDSSISAGCRVNQIVTDPSDPTGQTAVAVTNRYSAAGSSHIFRTTNGGAAWTDITGNFPNLPTWSAQIDTDPSHTIYVSNDTGVWMSISPYSAWIKYGAGLPNVQFLDLELNRNLGILAAGTHGRGAWEIYTPAHVVGISTSTANGTYLPGTTIPLTVTFSRAVNVTGTPQLTLNTSPNATATYSSGSGTNALTFQYTIAIGQATSGNATGGDLDYTSTSALDLNGGTIKDTGGISAVLALYVPGAAGSLSATNKIVISPKGTPTVTVTPQSTAIAPWQSLSVTVMVSGGAGAPTPTGTVILSGGGYASAATALTNGSVTFTIPAGSLPAGSDNLTANYTPDTNSSTDYIGASGKTATAIAVAPIAATVTVTPASTMVTPWESLSVTVTVGGGTGSPAATGSVILSGGGYTSAATALTNGSVTFTIPAGTLATGSDTLAASYTPDVAGSANYKASAGTSASLTVGKGTPTVTVTPASKTLTTAESLSVTITVSGGNGSPTATGSVTLSGGGYASSATTLASGSATIVIPAGALVVGNDALTASYSGNTNYNSQTGNAAVSVTVPPAFTLSPSPASVSVVPGASSTTVLSITAIGGFSGNIAFSATGLPTGVTASFAAGTTANTEVMTVTAASSTASTTSPVTVTVTGASGTISNTTTISLTVLAVPGFVGGNQNPTSLTISSGSNSGTATIQVLGTNGFSGTVNLSCSVSSTGSVIDKPTCSMVPASVTISGSTQQSSTLTIAINGTTASNSPVSPLLPPAGATAFALAIFFLVPKRRRNWLVVACVLFVFVPLSTIGCGGSSSSNSNNNQTTAGTYTATVTGTSGSTTSTIATLNVTVQ
ncbi:MAG: Ig-like domain repeat protein [Acidobacteriota bacterium]